MSIKVIEVNTIFYFADVMHGAQRLFASNFAKRPVAQ